MSSSQRRNSSLNKDSTNLEYNQDLVLRKNGSNESEITRITLGLKE